MITLSEATASNKCIASTFAPGLVAVFVGGTSGVGEYTVQAFAKYAPKPRVYIVGRSQEAADRILGECRSINSQGIYEFIKADVSLLKSVDEVCRQIKAKETVINILMQSQGSMAFDKTTSEGLPFATALVMHSRIRFIMNLLPLLQKAPSLRRVVSVDAATLEGPIDLENIYCKGFSLFKRRDQGSCIVTLLLEEAARRAPDVSFVHTLPGVVKGGIMRDAEGLGMAVIIGISRLLDPLIRTLPAECAERHVFMATSAVFAPSQNDPAVAGVSLDAKATVARGTEGKPGSGVYSINHKGEMAPTKVEELLATYRQDGTARKVWEFISADIQKITGTEVAL